MQSRWTFFSLIAVLSITLAWTQLRPSATSPLIRPSIGVSPLRTFVRYPISSYRTEVVTMARADEHLIPGSRYLSRDPDTVGRQNQSDRNNGMLRLRTLITQAGLDGWVLDRMESLGQGGSYEDVLVVFRRPPALAN